MANLKKIVDIRILTLVASLVGVTTLVPSLQQGFFADDFAFLNWTSNLTFHEWLNAFQEPGAFNLTYRPMALFVYLVYLTGSAPLCYSLLVVLYIINIVVFYYFLRRLSNPFIAGLSIVIFACGFVYHDATHKVYNLITQLSALFLLVSLQLFLRDMDGVAHAGSRSLLSYMFYTLSLLTYEITLFGFCVFSFVSLCRLSNGKAERIRPNLMLALKTSWGFGLISLVYLLVNYLSPIKAAHLRDHAIPITWSTVTTVFSRAKDVLKYTLAWIATMDWQALGSYSLSPESWLLFIVLILMLAWLLVASLRHLRNGEKMAGPEHGFLMLLGVVWFIAFLLPGAVSIYFDYRMTFLAYAGFSVLVASLVHACYITVAHAIPGGREFTIGCVAVSLSCLLSLWLLSNLSLTLRMNRSLLQSSRQQWQILTSLRPYLPKLQDDSVIVVQYRHEPTQTLPYPYQASPFAEDYALSDALRFYFGREFSDASLFFRAQGDRFEVGRFSFAQNRYSFDRLVLFTYEKSRLVLQKRLKVLGSDIVLPRAVSASPFQ